MKDDTVASPPAEDEAIPGELLFLGLAQNQLHFFFPLLQRGVELQAFTGCSLRELLCAQLGIPADYVTGRITTIFLNNRPVDDLEGTQIGEGSRVTLSAAMPGLVGAVMRRSGFYAALRQGITHAENAERYQAGQGTIRLKLFNLLLPELAPLVLARGILLERGVLAELLDHLSEAGPVTEEKENRLEQGSGKVLVKVRIAMEEEVS